MEPSGTAYFAGFALQPASRRLTRRGREVHLTPKEFDLLALLAAHPGCALSKEEIHHAVWRDAAVEEGSLTQTVSLLRKALAAYPGGAGCVETVARYGYRLAVPVRWAPAALPWVAVRFRRITALAAAALLLLLALWSYLFLYARS
ncbi:MAG: transcriptional regulator [Acidobacteria bacterium]|nr:transcriptional regulator [Acidobacteriota bacterium]